ncbi:hypothetical protein RA19_10355 [Leisingera sp. ANG-M1]|uniref:hypothetical protein n=1 Tax=Leisingera sp. ANG-M1 TaxID=1577895 RepID=UPI00057D7469|nr:hypothetical protein [Leisingera sp. ANG-M1]KIC10783.1 hypothetical protein RA19_10355 [Leisingera sp. ANG-M1]
MIRALVAAFLVLTSVVAAASEPRVTNISLKWQGKLLRENAWKVRVELDGQETRAVVIRQDRLNPNIFRGGRAGIAVYLNENDIARIKAAAEFVSDCKFDEKASRFENQAAILLVHVNC